MPIIARKYLYLIEECNGLQKQLEAMQQDLDKPIKIDAKALNESDKKLASYFDNAHESNDYIKAIIRVLDLLRNFAFSEDFNTVTNSFDIVRFCLLGLDFLSLPITYLVARITGKAFNPHASKVLKGVYLGIAVALVVTATVLPFTAPVIALVLAVASLGVSLFTLGSLIYEQQLLKRECKKISKALAREEQVMEEIKERAVSLRRSLEACLGALESDLGTSYLLPNNQDRFFKCTFRSTTPTRALLFEREQIALQAKIAAISEELLFCKEEARSQFYLLQSLKTKEAIVNKKLASYTTAKYIDKSLAVFLGTVSIIGLIVAPLSIVGVYLLAAVVVIGSLYIFAKNTPPFLRWLGKQAKSLIEKITEILNSPGPEEIPLVSLTGSIGADSTGTPEHLETGVELEPLGTQESLAERLPTLDNRSFLQPRKPRSPRQYAEAPSVDLNAGAEGSSLGM